MHKHPEKILEQLNNLYKFALFCMFNTSFGIVFRSCNLIYPVFYILLVVYAKANIIFVCVCVTDMIGP